MTALIDRPPEARTSRPKSRILGVVRLQFTNRQTFIWMPLLILTGAWLITLIIHWIIASAGVDGPMYSGSSQAPLWYFAIVGAQAVNLTFYFSQAMSLTRREFCLGSFLAAAISAVGMSAVFVVMGFIEQATDGYGMNGYVSYLPWVWEHGPLGAGFVYFVLTILCYILGFWFAIVYKRFGTLILTSSLIAIALALLAGAAWVNVNQAWPEVWAALVDAQAVGLALWALGLSAVFALGSYLTVRRLTT